MATALTDAQLQLLRMAQIGDVPLPRELRRHSYFRDFELLALLKLVEARDEWFALTPLGARYIDYVTESAC